MSFNEYQRNCLHAGRLAAQVRAEAKKLIIPGASYQSIISFVRERIMQLGAVCAFPPQISLDHVAAHCLLPSDTTLYLSNEVVKLDLGVCYQGAMADCAVTVDLSGECQKLIEATEKALEAVASSLYVGQTTGEIGRIIETTIHSYGFQPVKNLSGHGLGHYKIHTSPQVPNWNDGSKTVITPNMLLAIEPFATEGGGWVEERGEATLFACSRLPRPSPVYGWILPKLASLKGLPFSLDDLLQPGVSTLQIKRALHELTRHRMIEAYPALWETSGGRVAQTEDTFFIDKAGKVHITTGDLTPAP